MSFPLDETKYEILNLIGVGTGSRVYEARCIANDQKVAIKQLNLREFPLDLHSIQDQTAVWLNCNHPNITKFYGLIVSQNDPEIIWLLIEFMAAGSLLDVIKFAYGRGFRDESIIATILGQVVSGLKYIHDKQQVHHDIRSSKILLHSDGTVKLTEVGLNTSLVKTGSKRASTLSLFGEECYMAPEVLKNENDYNPKSDIWSLGLTAVELGTGKMPYAGMRFMESLVRIIDNDPPCLPESGNFSANYKDFVKVCLVKNLVRRATAKDLSANKFLKSSMKGPEIIQRTIISSLPSISEIYKQLHPGVEVTNIDSISTDDEIIPQMAIAFPNAGNASQTSNSPPATPTAADSTPVQDPENSKPVQKVGRFKVTRSSDNTGTSPKASPHPSAHISPSGSGNNIAATFQQNESQQQTPQQQTPQQQTQQQQQQQQRPEVEELAEELMRLASEMQMLQSENSSLKEKMEEISAVIQNLQQQKKTA